MHIRQLTGPTILILAMAFAVQTHGATAAPAPLARPARTDLQRHDLAIAGQESVQVRIDFDIGVSAPLHRHPGDEIVYVLGGTLEYQIEGRTPLTLRQGDVLFVPAGLAHSVRNVGGEKASELATYIVPKGEPLVVLVK